MTRRDCSTCKYAKRVHTQELNGYTCHIFAVSECISNDYSRWEYIPFDDKYLHEINTSEFISAEEMRV